MQLMCFINKVLWALGRVFASTGRSIYFRTVGRGSIRRVGRRTRFFGRIRFGSAESNITIGSDCMLGHDLFLSASPGAQMTIGDGCSINTGSHLVALKGIEIGNHTQIAEYCSIRDQNHVFDDYLTPIADQGFNGSPIVIGCNVWIGRGVFVGPGVNIGDGAVIGANSVVTRNIPPHVVAAGAPARIIRQITGRGRDNPTIAAAAPFMARKYK